MAKSSFKSLDKALLLELYKKMLYSRILEERLIKIYKAGDAFFWIGGPGEEAWGVSLGQLVLKGKGPQYDYLHLHYRATPTLVAMGMPMIDSIRLIMNRVTDPCTGGRNFSNHYCFPKWNVTPVTSPIGVQYATALGTAHVQKRQQSSGISIITGGDAGTAEGDFASCLIWSSRKGQELPLLITVQNNRWGISTSFEGQHGETHIADRARAFNIPALVIDGTDPIESYKAVESQMSYIRKTGKPAFIEAHVTRLYGHSSASGANMSTSEVCPLQKFEQSLLQQDFLSSTTIKIWRDEFEAEGFAAQQSVRSELSPQSASVWDHVYADAQNPDWRTF